MASDRKYNTVSSAGLSTSSCLAANSSRWPSVNICPPLWLSATRKSVPNLDPTERADFSKETNVVERYWTSSSVKVLCNMGNDPCSRRRETLSCTPTPRPTVYRWLIGWFPVSGKVTAVTDFWGEMILASPGERSDNASVIWKIRKSRLVPNQVGTDMSRVRFSTEAKDAAIGASVSCWILVFDFLDKTARSTASYDRGSSRFNTTTPYSGI